MYPVICTYYYIKAIVVTWYMVHGTRLIVLGTNFPALPYIKIVPNK